MFSSFKAVVMMIAGASIAIAVNRAIPSALAQGDVVCGTALKPCELTGFKLLSNQNLPEIRVLLIETKQGPRTFVATRAIMERFAKELLDALEGGRTQNL
jgi:hypothetical protein